MAEICCDLCKYWLSELKECGNTNIDKCVNKEHFVKTERNCGTCEREIYNQALEDFYNGLAEELLWIKEQFGDDAYTKVWCSVGCLQNRLTKY